MNARLIGQGCFERQIDLMDNLNSLVSSVANDAVQRTQEIWWAHNTDFPVNPETGEEVTPKSGQWVKTYSAEGKDAKIAPCRAHWIRLRF